MLDKDQLFYYKNEKQSKSNISYFTECDYRGQKLQSNNAGERADSNLELDWVQVTETLLRNWEREQKVCSKYKVSIWFGLVGLCYIVLDSAG